MSQSLRITLFLHALVAFVFGLGLLAAPGQFLDIFGWQPVDPLISRILGAAMLALGWGSIRGYRAASWEEVEILVEVETAFTVLAAVGLLRHLLVGSWPWYVWMVFAIFTVFALAWVYHLLRKK
jgi:hypothetical protein